MKKGKDDVATRFKEKRPEENFEHFFKKLKTWRNHFSLSQFIQNKKCNLHHLWDNLSTITGDFSQK